MLIMWNTVQGRKVDGDLLLGKEWGLQRSIKGPLESFWMNTSKEGESR